MVLNAVLKHTTLCWTHPLMLSTASTLALGALLPLCYGVLSVESAVKWMAFLTRLGPQNQAPPDTSEKTHVTDQMLLSSVQFFLIGTPVVTSGIRAFGSLVLSPILDIRGRRPMVYTTLFIAAVCSLVFTLVPDSLICLVALMGFEYTRCLWETGALLHLVECVNFFNYIWVLTLARVLGTLMTIVILIPESIGYWYLTPDINQTTVPGHRHPALNLGPGDQPGPAHFDTMVGVLKDQEWTSFSFMWCHFCLALVLSVYALIQYRFRILYDSPAFLVFQDRHFLAWESIKFLMSRAQLVTITDSYRRIYCRLTLPSNQPTIRRGLVTTPHRALKVVAVVILNIFRRAASRSLGVALVGMFVITYVLEVIVKGWIRNELLVLYGEQFRVFTLLILEMVGLPAIVLAYTVRKHRRDFVSIACLSCLAALFCLTAHVATLDANGLSQYQPSFTSATYHPLDDAADDVVGYRVPTNMSWILIASILTLRILTAALHHIALCTMIERVTVGCRGTLLGVVLAISRSIELYFTVSLTVVHGYLPLTIAFITLALISFKIESSIVMLGEYKPSLKLASSHNRSDCIIRCGSGWSSRSGTSEPEGKIRKKRRTRRDDGPYFWS